MPPVPLRLGWRERIRLGRDYYVRLDASDYSVDPTAIGRMLDITADLGRVRARLDGRAVSSQRRSGAQGISQAVYEIISGNVELDIEGRYEFDELRRQVAALSTF